MPKDQKILRMPVEQKYENELTYLESIDTNTKPFSWRLSPKIVKTFILGASPKEKLEHKIEQKWYGDPAIVERAIVTLASDRGLLLIGAPGTGKSWLAELLSAAISSNSTFVVQGTAGTTEEHIKYSWNVAMVIAEGQSMESLIPSPIMTAMTHGYVGRFEELTRCSSDVQDSLISILSEKYIAIPELNEENVIFAQPGFNIIATANSRDRGVNELSSALKRRFNFVHIPIVTNKTMEKEIIEFRTKDLMNRHGFDVEIPPSLLDILLQTFADLREANIAASSDDQKLEASLSTAEQIGVLEDSILKGSYFGQNKIEPAFLAQSLVGTLVRRVPEDVSVMNKFWFGVVEKHSKDKKGDWKNFFEGGVRAMELFKK